MSKRLVGFILLFALSGTFAACGSDDDALQPGLLATVPVLHEGRVKPLDTFARVHLLAFKGKSSLKGMTALEWLTEVLLNPSKAYGRDVFIIRNPDVVEAYKLPRREGNTYSFREVSGGLQGIFQNVTKLHNKKREERTPAQEGMVRLYLNIMRFYELSRSLSLVLPDFVVYSDRLAAELKLPHNQPIGYLTLSARQKELERLAAGLKHKSPENLSDYQKDILELTKRLGAVDRDQQSLVLRIMPPQWKEDKDLWFSPWGLVGAGRGSARTAKYLKQWRVLAENFRAKDGVAFNATAGELLAQSHQLSRNVASEGNLKVERAYNRLDPFTWSLSLYVLGFLFLMFSWMFKPALFSKLSLGALGLGVLLHAAGVLLRMYIMSRPPVATLYESIIFVGLTAAIAGLILERVKGNGLGLLIGHASGAALHFVGLGYAADGDSMGMLAAVLNTNFWLASHVVTISIGYGACFVGALLGHVYLIRKIVAPQNKEALSEIYRIMVGVSLVALFFSMFGTILGGIWADQSWGRFWGWDPKENGALLICLWLLVMLHGRIAAYIKGVGFALGMVMTGIIVSLAWFGVNLLNVGLHSYGFTDSIALNLGLFCGFELLFMAVAYSLTLIKLEFRHE